MCEVLQLCDVTERADSQRLSVLARWLTAPPVGEIDSPSASYRLVYFVCLWCAGFSVRGGERGERGGALINKHSLWLVYLALVTLGLQFWACSKLFFNSLQQNTSQLHQHASLMGWALFKKWMVTTEPLHRWPSQLWWGSSRKAHKVRELIFDVYCQTSIQDAERVNRGADTTIQHKNLVGGHYVRQWRKFLCSNKSSLITFLVEEWKHPQYRELLHGKDLYITC